MLVAAALRLDAFIEGFEDRFLVFGGRLQQCLARAERIAAGASRAVQAVGGEALEQLAGRFREQAEVLDRHAASGDGLLEEITRRLDQTVASVATITGFQQGFGATVRSLRTLGVASLIESARMGEAGKEFSLLANDVSALGEEIADRFAEVLARSGTLQRELGDSMHSVVSARRAQQQRLQQALARLWRRGWTACWQ
jgi:NTP pyrophosphatase (non-canonical NTP hydrolase)